LTVGLLIACGVGCDGSSSANTAGKGTAGNGSTAGPSHQTWSNFDRLEDTLDRALFV
jgi:hypothetical protein